MRDDVERLRQRTKDFALRVISVYNGLPNRRDAETMGFQLLRAGTSVGAQYREACRARSNAEIISKLESVLQELDESDYWMELLVESKIVTEQRMADLRKEANELTAMFVTSVVNIKSNRR